MSEHRLYTGKEILELPQENNKPIIDSFLYERDNAILVGKAKMGKSILAQQMAFSISCGGEFLNEFKTKKGNCLYIQLEGKLGQTRNNINNMLEGVDWQEDNFNLLYYFGLSLNNSYGLDILLKLIDGRIAEGMPKPILIIIDPLYMAMQGNLCDQEQASNMCRHLRIIGDRYSSSILIIHHEHRIKHDDKGRIIMEGEEALFGSFVWQAFPDHIFLLNNIRGKGKELTCNTQRSAKIIPHLELDFIEPVPLMFERKTDLSHYVKIVYESIDDKGMDIREIADKSRLPINTVRSAVARLRQGNKIERLENRFPYIWKKK